MDLKMILTVHDHKVPYLSSASFRLSKSILCILTDQIYAFVCDNDLESSLFGCSPICFAF